MKKVFIDSDVFVRDLRYPNDEHAKINSQFVEKVRSQKIPGVTSLFNVLEVCGVLSFNLSEERIFELYKDFTSLYSLKIFYAADKIGQFDYDHQLIFKYIQKKICLGDAQVASVVEKFENMISCFVTWNVKDYAGKLPVPVKSPRELC